MSVLDIYKLHIEFNDTTVLASGGEMILNIMWRDKTVEYYIHTLADHTRISLPTEYAMDPKGLHVVRGDTGILALMGIEDGLNKAMGYKKAFHEIERYNYRNNRQVHVIIRLEKKGDEQWMFAVIPPGGKRTLSTSSTKGDYGRRLISTPANIRIYKGLRGQKEIYIVYQKWGDADYTTEQFDTGDEMWIRDVLYEYKMMVYKTNVCFYTNIPNSKFLRESGREWRTPKLCVVKHNNSYTILSIMIRILTVTDMSTKTTTTIVIGRGGQYRFTTPNASTVFVGDKTELLQYKMDCGGGRFKSLVSVTTT